MKRITASAAAVVAALALSACTGDIGSRGETLTGTIATTRYTSLEVKTDTEDCVAQDTPLSKGASIIVSEVDGTVLGQGTLGPGNDNLDVFPPRPDLPNLCQFAFTIPDIPADRDSYRIALQSQPDNYVLFTNTDLQSRDWNVTLTFN